MAKIWLKTVLVSLCLCATAIAADEQVARSFAKQSGFVDEMDKMMKSLVRGTPAEKKLASFDFKPFEDAYVASLVKHMSNAEIASLSKAYNIPGYRDAMRKMPVVTKETLDAVQRIATPVAK